MAYWTLQANPGIYRIFDALGDAEAIRTWTVAHHREVIASGDEFALWASGPNSGIYAFGVVTEPAEFRPDEPDPYWEGSGTRSTGLPRRAPRARRSFGPKGWRAVPSTFVAPQFCQWRPVR